MGFKESLLSPNIKHLWRKWDSNSSWKLASEYIEPFSKLLYQDHAFPSKVVINILIKQSSGNWTLRLCTCIWNLTKWRASLSFFSSLNIGRSSNQSTSGIGFGKPGIWDRFIGAYLAFILAVELIFKLHQATDLLAVESPSNLLFNVWSRQGSFAASKRCLSSCYLQKFSLLISGMNRLQAAGRRTKMLSQNEALEGCRRGRLQVTISNQSFS